MTTEIAIINRLGVALATDSAVTISGGGRTKVWDTADKLFELSSVRPVGIMINGNMDFLGIPWEILIREFRLEVGSENKSSVKDWMDDFLKYIERHPDVMSGNQKYIHRVVKNKIEQIQRAVYKEINEIVNSSQFSPRQKGPRIVISELLLSEIDKEIAILTELGCADSLSELTIENILENYKIIFDEVIAEKFPKMPSHSIVEAEVVALRSLLAITLKSGISSSYATGLVFAGYGKGIFPSVHAVEVDGTVAGKLKYIYFESETVDDANGQGKVVSFAQTDVIERLLGGADPQFVDKTAEFIRDAVAKIGRTVEEGLRSRNIKGPEVRRREKLIEDISELVASEYRTDVAVELRKKLEREFERMIALMPKQELIELAEALVSITAVERKASADEGTVGGPIDVAFIAKHEGFVWIKRKHYFDKDLNPRFFWRISRQLESRGES